MTFLDLQSVSYLDFQWRNRKTLDFIKNIFICVSKINKSLKGLEQHECEWMMTEFSFFGELSALWYFMMNTDINKNSILPTNNTQ